MGRIFAKSLQKNWVLLIVIILFDLLVSIAVYIVGTISHIPLENITNDPAAVYGNYFIGDLSNLGIMLWAAAASICFLGAILLHQISSKSRFLFYSGMLTTLLALDDALMFHEIIVDYLYIPEWLVYVSYLLLIVIYIIYFRREILTLTDYPILALALLFFVVSITSNLFFQSFPSHDLEPFLKDNAKFYGITLWLYYFFLTVVKLLKPHINVTAENE